MQSRSDRFPLCSGHIGTACATRLDGALIAEECSSPVPLWVLLLELCVLEA